MTPQPDGGDDTVVERFRPTSGRFSGVLGLVTAGVVVLLALEAWDPGTPLGVAIVACFGAVLVWTALLRPTLWATGRDLVMRNMLHTDHIPLAAIDRVAVGQVLAVSAGGKRYVSPAIGYTARQSIRSRTSTRAATEKPPSAGDTAQIFVEERILHLANEARERWGIAEGSPEQQALAADVRRSLAWPELAGLTVLAAAFLAWVLL